MSKQTPATDESAIVSWNSPQVSFKRQEYEYSCPPAVALDGWKSVTAIRRTRLWYDPDEEAPASPERILAAAIGRFAIYPFGLMCSDAVAVRNLLERLTELKPRLFAHSGVIRKLDLRDLQSVASTMNTLAIER